MSANLDIRPSPIAGQWYLDDPRLLSAKVDGYIRDATLPQLDGEVVAIVTPHAGHVYSGPVAGYSFATLRGLKPDLVAVVSPMHYPYPQALLTTAHSAYETPLGVIPVDVEAVQRLNDSLEKELGYGLAYVRRDPEHSLEIELPFLQRVLGEFRLLPVMILDQSETTAQALGLALAEVLGGKRALLVGSSDLSHFYPDSTARKLDAEMMRRIAAFDPAAVIRAEDEEAGFACGRAAIAAVLWAARGLGANLVTTLAYGNSGDVTGDRSSVVGYGAAAIWRHSAA